MWTYNSEGILSSLDMQLLAEIFQDLLTNRDDYLRALRALFREISRVVRQDLHYTDFCLGLMQERTEAKFRDLEPAVKVSRWGNRITLRVYGISQDLQLS